MYSQYIYSFILYKLILNIYLILRMRFTNYKTALNDLDLLAVSLQTQVKVATDGTSFNLHLRGFYISFSQCMNIINITCHKCVNL
jgi:hypothetical protein